MREKKRVTSKQLRIGQKVDGWSEGRHIHFGLAIVKFIGPDGVVLSVFDSYEERVSPDTIFDVELTDEEFCKKYLSGAKAVMEALCNRLASYEIGEHEMNNSWLCSNPYEMAAECVRGGFRLVGYCTDIIPKRAMFSGELLDVGICAEYEDGVRFWCHYKSEDLFYTFFRFSNLVSGSSPWIRND